MLWHLPGTGPRPPDTEIDRGEMDHKPYLVLVLAAATACSSNVRYRPSDTPAPPAPDVVASVYLVGDGGLLSPGRTAVLAHLRTDLERHVRDHPDAPALVAFLGDNIYDVGARRGFRSQDLAKLSGQVRAVIDAPTVRGVFLPGNHDWGAGASDGAGRTAVQIQQQWIEEIEGSRNVGFLPDDECPGPASVNVAADVHVVFIDTEWLLRLPEDGCGGADLFYERLRAELVRLRGQRVVLAAHHPVETGGPHGGNVGFFDRGPGVYFLAVKSGLSIQDLASGRYRLLIDNLRDAIRDSGHRPLAMAAGHDHSLQVIRLRDQDLPRYQLVSGSASKSSRVARVDGTRFASSAHGYLRLDFTADRSRVVAYGVGGQGSVRPMFACRLSHDAAETCAEALRVEGGS